MKRLYRTREKKVYFDESGIIIFFNEFGKNAGNLHAYYAEDAEIFADGALFAKGKEDIASKYHQFPDGVPVWHKDISGRQVFVSKYQQIAILHWKFRDRSRSGFMVLELGIENNQMVIVRESFLYE